MAEGSWAAAPGDRGGEELSARSDPSKGSVDGRAGPDQGHPHRPTPHATAMNSRSPDTDGVPKTATEGNSFCLQIGH
jgi:hypothetical protein